MKQWDVNIRDLIVAKNDFPSKLLILAGPSGAGKTTLATMLEETWSDYYVVTNYTTREPRNEDPPGHFVYIDTDTFHHLQSNEHFFLCRYGEEPHYGYSLEEVNLAISHSKLLVFMFRHSGIKNILSIFPCVPTVFLTGHPKEIAGHSKASGASYTYKYNVSRVKRTLNSNNRIAAMMENRDCDFLTLKNSYNGYEELQEHKMRISQFCNPDEND